MADTITNMIGIFSGGISFGLGFGVAMWLLGVRVSKLKNKQED